MLETEPLEESASLIEIRDETDENTNEDDVKEIKEKEPEPVVIDDEDPKPDEIKSDILPLLSTEENPDDEKKASEDIKEQEEAVDDLDNSEQDVCIILPEEEIPIVKIDDTADDEDDVFKENESSNESIQTVVKHKMEEVVLADGSVVKIKSEPLDPGKPIFPLLFKPFISSVNYLILFSYDFNVKNIIKNSYSLSTIVAF